MTAFAGFLNDKPYWSPWQRKFILFDKLNDRWVFCRRIYRRYHLYSKVYGPIYEYALNDFELIQKSEME